MITHPVSSFQVIDQKGFAVSVFIELDDEAKAAKDAFLKLIHKKLDKATFDSKYKLTFNQRIVTVPKYLPKVSELIQGSKSNELVEGLYIVNHHEVSHYYNELTGFDRSKEGTSAGQTSFF